MYFIDLIKLSLLRELFFTKYLEFHKLCLVHLLSQILINPQQKLFKLIVIGLESLDEDIEL